MSAPTLITFGLVLAAFAYALAVKSRLALIVALVGLLAFAVARALPGVVAITTADTTVTCALWQAMYDEQERRRA